MTNRSHKCEPRWDSRCENRHRLGHHEHRGWLLAEKARSRYPPEIGRRRVRGSRRRREFRPTPFRTANPSIPPLRFGPEGLSGWLRVGLPTAFEAVELRWG